MNSPNPTPRWEERRVSPRVKLCTPIHLASHSNFYTGFTDNISEGGVFVATHNVFPVGTIVRLELMLPGDDEPIDVLGEVRWTVEYSETSDGHPGLGVKFIQLSERNAERIRRFTSLRDPLFYE